MNARSWRALALGAFLALSAPSSHAAEGPPLVIKSGWVREKPAGAGALQAFLIVENNSLVVQSIVLVEAEGFAGVEMLKGGPGGSAANDLPIEQMDIPIFGRRVLEPYGEYLLLTGAKRAYRAGDRITLTIQLADGKQQTVTLPVRRDPDE